MVLNKHFWNNFGVKAAIIDVRKHGEQAIAKKRRGQQHGERAALSPTQCKIIQKFITDRCPDQLKMPFALSIFSAKASYARSLVGNFLRAWGYTTQKPLHRSYSQQPQRIER